MNLGLKWWRTSQGEIELGMEIGPGFLYGTDPKMWFVKVKKNNGIIEKRFYKSRNAAMNFIRKLRKI